MTIGQNTPGMAQAYKAILDAVTVNSAIGGDGIQDVVQIETADLTRDELVGLVKALAECLVNAVGIVAEHDADADQRAREESAGA
jgi:hypothetical protein